MKTAVVVYRQFNGKEIRQDSKTEFLNVNDLFNCFISENPMSGKRLDSYFGLLQTKEFSEAIRESELEAKKQNTKENGDFVLPLFEPIPVLCTKRGKNGGTWVHPYLFLDFAMWLSPRFKVWAMSVIEDKLIKLRNEAGDKYKEMAAALKSTGAVSPREYAREATMLNTLVFGKSLENRDNATETQLDLLNKLQKYNALLITQGASFNARQKECENFIKLYDFISK